MHRFFRLSFSFAFAAGLGFAFPCVSFAVATITEIMYDLPGTDTGREWIEVQNTGNTEISFLKWKLFEANTNHGLTLFQGNATTSASGFAIIADDPTKFLADNPAYSGTLYKSSFSLSNTGETLELKLDNANVFQATYTSGVGGAGDGNSLHFSNNTWQSGIPTPGMETENPPPAAPHIPDVPNTATSTTIEEETPTPTPPPPANSGGSTWVYKPHMFVSALVPQKAVAGAPVTFDAAAVGVKKEPLPNARYIWSFGDGGVAEGKKAQHTYHYPATYTVLVDASSGEWSALDKKEISIAAPELTITGIKEGGNGYIEVKNNGQSEVDLSDWLLLAGSGSFRFPRGTVIGAKKAVPFPAAITGLPADSSSTVLLYPNGTPVVAYAEMATVSEPEPLKAEEPRNLGCCRGIGCSNPPTRSCFRASQNRNRKKNNSLSGSAPCSHFQHSAYTGRGTRRRCGCRERKRYDAMASGSSASSCPIGRRVYGNAPPEAGEKHGGYASKRSGNV